MNSYDDSTLWRMASMVNMNPTLFHEVCVSCNEEELSYTVHCRVEPGAEDEDQVQDLYQAIIDMCARDLADKKIKSASVSLEYPDISKPEAEFEVARKDEIFFIKKDVIRFHRQYWDFGNQKYRNYNQDLMIGY